MHGWPDSEGNALLVLRALEQRYRGRVVWLLNDLDYAPPRHLAADLAGIRRLRKDSVRGWLTAISAEATFFTHGIYTAVAPPGNRLVVNLWHGDGPKLGRDVHQIESTVAVSGTQLWGRRRAERFGLPPDSVAIVGNPRIDDLVETIDDATLDELGIDGSRPLVLWLPTYRAASGPRRQTWTDADRLSDGNHLAELVAACAHARDDLGIDVVLKPHPLDSDTYVGLGFPMVTNADLDRLGIDVYQLLGMSTAIISDISSVWTDYLALDRPIGFYAPDLEALQAGRGFNVEDLESLLPGLRVTGPESLRTFFEGVGRGDASPPAQRVPRLRPDRPEPARWGQ